MAVFNIQLDPNKTNIAGIGTGIKPVTIPLIPGVSGLEQISINPYDKTIVGVNIATCIVSSYVEGSVFDGTQYGNTNLSDFYAFRMGGIPIDEAGITQEEFKLTVWQRKYPLLQTEKASYTDITPSVSRSFDLTKDILIPPGVPVFWESDKVEGYKASNSDLIFIRKTLLDIPNYVDADVIPRLLVIRFGTQLTTISNDFTSSIEYEGIFSKAMSYTPDLGSGIIKGIELTGASGTAAPNLTESFLWLEYLENKRFCYTRQFNVASRIDGYRNSPLQLTDSSGFMNITSNQGSKFGFYTAGGTGADNTRMRIPIPVNRDIELFGAGGYNKYSSNINSISTITHPIMYTGVQFGHVLGGMFKLFVYVLDTALNGGMVKGSCIINYDNPLLTPLFYLRFGDISGIPTPTFRNRQRTLKDLTTEYVREENYSDIYGREREEIEQKPVKIDTMEAPENLEPITLDTVLEDCCNMPEGPGENKNKKGKNKKGLDKKNIE